MISQEYSYRTHFECFMQDSIHLMAECDSTQLHFAVIDREGNFNGLVCCEHIGYTRSVNRGDSDGPFHYAPFWLLKDPNYTR